MCIIRHLIPTYFIALADQECLFLTFTLSSHDQSGISVSVPSNNADNSSNLLCPFQTHPFFFIHQH